MTLIFILLHIIIYTVFLFAGVILKTGEVLDIENIDVENMSKENKFETIQKMQSVMDNMQQLMQKLSQKI